jgi:hypothetical protein
MHRPKPGLGGRGSWVAGDWEYKFEWVGWINGVVFGGSAGPL